MPSAVHPNVESINAKFAFSGNPIIVKVTNLGFSGLFRQVVIKVTTYYDKPDSNARSYMFYMSADGAKYDDVISCDISSAIRSSFSQFRHDPAIDFSGGSATYPMVTYKIEAWARELVDGVVRESGHTEAEAAIPGTDKSTKVFRAYLGGLSERERWHSGETTNIANIPTKFSTKPLGGEFVPTGHIYTQTSMESDGHLKTTLSALSGPSLDSRPGTVVLFVNSRGVYETVSIMASESEEYEMESNILSLVGAASYRPSPSIISKKEGGGAVWKMSSGYVNKDWAQWYAREFLMAERYWIRNENRWIPVSISPDSDSVMTYDKNDPSLLSVNFVVRSAIKG